MLDLSSLPDQMTSTVNQALQLTEKAQLVGALDVASSAAETLSGPG